MKYKGKEYIALKDAPGITWADLSKPDPNGRHANDPFVVKKNEEAQRQLKESYGPKEIFEKSK